MQLCGDAHLANFGGFASPERDLVFDLNDFDETLPGPFEWDVKRLAASFEVAARNRNCTDAERAAIVQKVVRVYREAMRQFAGLGNMDVWYSRFSATELVAKLRTEHDDHQADALERATAKARTKDSMRAFKKLTHLVDGEPRIVSDPPLIIPIDELAQGISDRDALEAVVRSVFREYRKTLPPDRRWLLEEFRVRRCRPEGRRGRERRNALLDRAAARAATRTTRCSCRSRRPNGRCSSPISGPATTPTTVNASSPGSS